jgi:hypothetical protein
LNGATITGWDYLPSIDDPNWAIVGIGDFNADSKPDILWRNDSSGLNDVCYMNGATRTGGDSLLTIADLNWTIGNH